MRWKPSAIHSLIRSIPHPMVYYNLEGIIIDGNNQFEEMLGNSIKTLKGKSIYEQCSEDVAYLQRHKDIDLMVNKLNI